MLFYVLEARLFSATEIAGFYPILVTPTRRDSSAADHTSSVDVDELERLVRSLLDDGASGFIALGTTGECATLTFDEFSETSECIVATVNGRVPTFIGTTALGTRDVIERARRVADLGATGTLLGLPMWQPLTTSMAVNFYSEVAQAVPSLAIMVYANTRAFRYAFDADFWGRLAVDVPTATSAKVSRVDTVPEFIEASQGRIHFLPNEMRIAELFEAAPEAATACWATAASMGPSPIRLLMDAIANGDGAEVKLLDAEISWANEPIVPLVADPELFASYNIQVEKVRIAAAGYCNPGPIRSPYDDIPDRFAEASRECGERWAAMCSRLVDDG